MIQWIKQFLRLTGKPTEEQQKQIASALHDFLPTEEGKYRIKCSQKGHYQFYEYIIETEDKINHCPYCGRILESILLEDIRDRYK